MKLMKRVEHMKTPPYRLPVPGCVAQYGGASDETQSPLGNADLWLDRSPPVSRLDATVALRNE
jgi:hypothetical protein